MYMINQNRCIACGGCLEICPRLAIYMMGIATIDPLVCNECGECQEWCQVGAIEEINDDLFWETCKCSDLQ